MTETISTNARTALDDCQLLFPQRVAWGEMDAFQHVNNVIYFRYFESARIAYGHQVGMMDWRENEGLGPIVAATSIRYRRPVLFPDNLVVGVRIARMTKDRFWQHYRIYSETQQQITTEGEAEIVMFDYRHNRKAAIPDLLWQRIEKLELRSIIAESGRETGSSAS